MAQIIRPDFDKGSGDGPPRPQPVSRTTRIVDWLGATKPLHLIAGACGIIGIIGCLAEALR